MAKAHQSSSTFLIGFLLLLVVADVAYVCVGSPCGEIGGHVYSQSCDDCDSLCISASSFLVHHTNCVTANFPGYMSCQCCMS
ncbi:hypothetical protein MKW94_028982 [Papaver nudicaule]|uniref:Uncharacterized protein n=1 Tax=Papaver nudicaule TaxID=74823 RepID=A0AA41VJD3_PAPNU|nr:hypothetical protein [Papaver nudicaule]